MDYSVLKGKKVVVTGSNGFIGSHLVKFLVEKRASVHCIVEPRTSLQNIEHLSDSLDIYEADIRDRRSIETAMENLEGDQNILVFHLAAQAHVGKSWDFPYQTFETNVLGTLNLLETLRTMDIGIEKVNIAGTSEEYGDTGKMTGRLDESSSLSPKSVYGTSKVAADFLGKNYYEAYGLPCFTTRMFNNYGPRQEGDYITPSVILQALKSDRVELGNLKPKRDMMYVEDGVKGHLAAGLQGKPGEIYTFGTGESISMERWVEKILEIGERLGYWQDIQILKKQERRRPGDSEVKDLEANSSKLKDLTGWQPEINHEEGLEKTIEWYAKNRD